MGDGFRVGCPLDTHSKSLYAAIPPNQQCSADRARQEALNLAFVGLGMPARHELRVEAAQFAAPAGLIGAAAEQALSAILVQVLGEDALMSSRTQFKSAREVLQEVRALLLTPRRGHHS